MNKRIKSPVGRNKIANVPVVMQLEALECGAACLDMILAYYDKWIPLEKVRSDCGVSRDGSNAKNVLMAARRYGLDAKGYRLEPEELAKSGTFPCMVHWEFNHFIVVNGIKNGKVYVNDPARGNITMSMENFDEGFSGIVLMFAPTEEFVPEGARKSMLSFAKKRLIGSGAAIAFVILTTVISSLFGIIKPGMSRIFLDTLLNNNGNLLVSPFFVLLIILAIFEIVVGWIGAIYSMRIYGKMAISGNATYMWKVLRMPMVFFTQRMAGDIQRRKDTNADIAKTLVDTFAPILINTAMMFFYLIVMLRYSVSMTIVGMITIVINGLVARIISKKRVNITRILMRDAGKLYGTTAAGIEMIETIKSSGSENGFFEKWAGYNANVNNGNVAFTKINSYLGIIPTIVNTISENIILIMGVYYAMAGEFKVGMIMAFSGFLMSFLSPASELISTGQTLLEMRTNMERVEDVMEYPMQDGFDELEKDEDIEYSKLSGNIELKDISFGYSPLAEPIIRDFNMTLTPGKYIALVGATGCGKSTISKLISGLYKPWSGSITFDGKKIEDIPRQILTGSIAVVDQDIRLFEDTISNNIRMWDSTIEDFEVILAARDAGIHKDIIEKKGGFEYKLNEGGSDFSGGQRQRIEIARVLAQDPTIVILDEATSALDAKTEYEVVNAIKARGITCIVIAHRLSTIRDCDEIIVLNKGEIVERGTHEELYQKDGYYKELVTSD